MLFRRIAGTLPEVHDAWLHGPCKGLLMLLMQAVFRYFGRSIIYVYTPASKKRGRPLGTLPARSESRWHRDASGKRVIDQRTAGVYGMPSAVYQEFELRVCVVPSCRAKCVSFQTKGSIKVRTLE